MRSTVQRRLTELERAIIAAPRRRLCCAADWASDVPPVAGVYAIWDTGSGRPVYVGETSGLVARMGDLGRTPNHTFRRIARKNLNAGSTTEPELDAMLAGRFEIGFLPVEFGRAELEEYLILRWRTTLYNKPALRLTKSAQYQWVKEAV